MVMACIPGLMVIDMKVNLKVASNTGRVPNNF